MNFFHLILQKLFSIGVKNRFIDLYPSSLGCILKLRSKKLYRRKMAPPNSGNQNARGRGGRTDGGSRGRGGGFSGNRGHVRSGRVERSGRPSGSGHAGGGFGRDNRLRFGGGNKGANNNNIRNPDDFSSMYLLFWSQVANKIKLHFKIYEKLIGHRYVCLHFKRIFIKNILKRGPDPCKKWNVIEQRQK